MRKGVATAAVVLSYGCVWLMILLGLSSAQESHQRTGITSGECFPTAQRFVTAINPTASKTAGVFALLPESISFKQGGSAPSCAILSFSAEVNAGSASAIQIRPLLDGQQLAIPAMVSLSEPVNMLAARTMNFIFLNVPPGRHVIRVEFAGTFSTASVQGRTLILGYMK